VYYITLVVLYLKNTFPCNISFSHAHFVELVLKLWVVFKSMGDFSFMTIVMQYSCCLISINMTISESVLIFQPF